MDALSPSQLKSLKKVQTASGKAGFCELIPLKLPRADCLTLQEKKYLNFKYLKYNRVRVSLTEKAKDYLASLEVS